MPWKVSTHVKERARFIEAWLEGEHPSMAALCIEFGISRKTGCKWVSRFKEGGLQGLHDRSKRFKRHPNTTPQEVVDIIVGARKRHPTWGPKKIHTWLERRGEHVPAVSTVGEILRREGMVVKRRRKPRPGEYSNGLSAQDKPNAVWGADFKGWFRLTSGGQKCYPLTISDGYSRFLLRCEALRHADELACRKVFDEAFVEFGLPETIRTDNGTPFSAVYGVSALSVWWVKLGIRPERITRGRPTENGRHERIHRTLQGDVINAGRVRRTMLAQQRVFDGFRAEYNLERPHEALDMRTPSTAYEASSRRYPTKLRSPEYGDDWEVYRVRRDGSIIIPGRILPLSKVLAGEPVGLRLQDDGSHTIAFGPLVLGTLTSAGRLNRGSRKPRRQRAPDDPSNEIPTG